MGGISGPDDVYVFGFSIAQSVGHRGGAIQCDSVGASVGGERGRSDGDRQRGSVRYLFPDTEADHADLRRPQPFGVRGDERDYVLSAVPRSAEQRFAEIGGELDPFSATPFLYDRIRAVDLSRIAAIPPIISARTGSANVRRQEHDVRFGSASWTIFDRVGNVQGTNEHEGGGRADAQCPEQELLVFCGVDPE